MPEFTYTVRASDERSAQVEAQRAAEADGVYVLRILRAVQDDAHAHDFILRWVDHFYAWVCECGVWRDDPEDRLFTVFLLGDRMSESEARALAGDR